MMIGKEKGNGINNDIARLIPSDIAIHNSCCERKSLLLLNSFNQISLLIPYLYYADNTASISTHRILLHALYF
jgi:hypothetical protein